MMMTIDMTATVAPVLYGLIVGLLASAVGVVATCDGRLIPRFGLRAAIRSLQRVAQASTTAVASGF